jgi:hypothetical protein
VLPGKWDNFTPPQWPSLTSPLTRVPVGMYDIVSAIADHVLIGIIWAELY